MEQNQEKKFVCKFCNKRFPCGKSLGAHIRTHMNNDNCGESETVPPSELISINKLLSNGRIIKRVAEAEADGQSSAAYGLRENPKKTKKFSNSGKAPLLREMICKECGKAFHSSKALCGHMACHSEKERVFCEKQKMVMDGQSDTETSSTPSKRRRSKRIRYKANGVYSNNSVSLANGSSSVSEIEQEQEEVAMCLMMLSRDSAGCCKKGLNSVADSSDNNSVILEAKSSSIDVRITIKNDMKCVPNKSEYLKMEKQRDNKLKSAESCPSSESSDSSYFRNGPKKVELEDFDSKFGKSLSKFKSLNTELPKDNNQVNRGLNKYDLRRSNAKNGDYCTHEAFCNNASKGSKYECSTCNKSFDSHRALGGHRANHTKANDYKEDSLANDGFIVPMTDTKETKSSPHGRLLNAPCGSLSGNAEKRLGSKKSKGHQCPFCFRVFKSGQALGGHKRSHFVGAAEDRTLVIKQESPDMPTATVIDLNLPAPVEDDAMGNVRFSPWEI